MKHLARVFVFNVFAIWMTTQIIPSFRIGGNWATLVFAGFILSLLMIVIAPLLKILFIPINIITFGLFSWVINAIVVYLLTVFVPEVSVGTYVFPGFSANGFSIPKIQFTYALSLIVSSLAITFFSNILHKISED